MTLTEFLQARIDEDEAAAHYATTRDGVTNEDWGGWWLGHYQHYSRYAPNRLLAECEAKRTIIAQHRHESDERGHVGCELCALNYYVGGVEVEPDGWCTTLKALAAVYADHDDYREEWRP